MLVAKLTIRWVTVTLPAFYNSYNISIYFSSKILVSLPHFLLLNAEIRVLFKLLNIICAVHWNSTYINILHYTSVIFKTVGLIHKDNCKHKNVYFIFNPLPLIFISLESHLKITYSYSSVLALWILNVKIKNNKHRIR